MKKKNAANALLCCFLLSAAVVLILSGCSGLQLKLGDKLPLLGIKQAGLTLGYFVGKSKTDADDIAIKDAYLLIRTGSLPPEAVSEAIVRLKIDNALIAASCFNALEAMGAVVSGGKIVDLAGIPAEAWAAAEASYTQGIEIGRAERAKKG